MSYSNPTMDALARGGSVANQGMSVANSMMQGVQRAMDSTSDLTFKMDTLLKQEQARKFNEGLKTAQFLQNQYQFNVQQKLANDQLQSVDAMRKSNIARNEKLNELTTQKIDEYNQVTKPINELKLKAMKGALNGTTGTTTAPATIDPNQVQQAIEPVQNIIQKGLADLEERYVSTDMDEQEFNQEREKIINLRDKTYENISTNFKNKFDTETKANQLRSEIETLKNQQYAMGKGFNQGTIDKKQAELNALTTSPKDLKAIEDIKSKRLEQTKKKIDILEKKRDAAYKTGDTDLANQISNEIVALNVAGVTEQPSLVNAASRVSTNTKPLVKPYVSREGDKTMNASHYDSARAVYKLDTEFKNDIKNNMHISSDKVDEVINGAIKTLEDIDVPVTDISLKSAIANKYIADKDTRKKYLSPEYQVATDISSLFTYSTKGDKRNSDRTTNDILYSLEKSPKYGQELNQIYNTMNTRSKEHFIDKIYNGVKRNYMSNHKFNTDQLVKNFPDDMFSDIFGMTKDTFKSATKNGRKLNEVIGSAIHPTAINMAKDSNAVDEFSSVNRTGEAFESSKNKLEDMTQRYFEYSVKPSDVSTAFKVFKDLYTSDNQFFTKLGDNDIAEKIDNGKMLYAAKDASGNNIRINPRELLISDDPDQTYGDLSHSGNYILLNQASLIKAVGSNIELKNKNDYKAIIGNLRKEHNSKVYGIKMMDSGGKPYTVYMTLDDIYGALSASIGQALDVKF